MGPFCNIGIGNVPEMGEFLSRGCYRMIEGSSDL